MMNSVCLKEFPYEYIESIVHNKIDINNTKWLLDCSINFGSNIT